MSPTNISSKKPEIVTVAGGAARARAPLEIRRNDLLKEHGGNFLLQVPWIGTRGYERLKYSDKRSGDYRDMGECSVGDNLNMKADNIFGAMTRNFKDLPHHCQYDTQECIKRLRVTIGRGIGAENMEILATALENLAGALSENKEHLWIGYVEAHATKDRADGGIIVLVHYEAAKKWKNFEEELGFITCGREHKLFILSCSPKCDNDAVQAANFLEGIGYSVAISTTGN